MPQGEVDVRIAPYRATLRAGEELELEVLAPAEASVELVVPEGWEVARVDGTRFRVRAGAPAVAARIGADVTLGGRRLGQLAEAVLEVR